MDMKMRKRHVFIAAAIVVILLWMVSFFSPEGAIRRYMVLHLHPISAFTSKMTDMGRYDLQYGHLYDVSGYSARTTRDALSVFYVKKKGPFWYVSSVGSAP